MPQTSTARELTLRRRAVRFLLRAEIIYIYTLAVFCVLALFARAYAYFAWDLAAAHVLQTLPVPGLFGLMRAVSTFGNGWIPYALTAVTAIIFLIRRRNSEAAALVLSAGGSSLINGTVKLMIARPRPSPDLVRVFRTINSESFPSGHVTFYVCYFGFLFFVAYALLPPRSLMRRMAIIGTVVPVVLIGFSRVYLGVHWPSDVLGAYMLSGIWLAFSLHMYGYWKKRATFHASEQQQLDEV